MPKFIRMLKAAGRSTIRATDNNKSQKNHLQNNIHGLRNHYSIRFMHNIASYVIIPTKKQACNPAEVGPGDVSRRANVLHVCKIQDDRHKADENKVGASNDAQKECSLPKFGTAQDHLKEDLRINEEEEGCECTKSVPLEKQRGIAEGAPAKHLSCLWNKATVVCLSH